MGEVKNLPGKIFCILCNGVVAFKNGDKSRFVGHMNHEHEAFSGINFILAGCLMSQEERTAVETIMEEKYNTGMIEVKRSDDVASFPDEIPQLTESAYVVQETANSEVNNLEPIPKLEENVPNVSTPPQGKEVDIGKVKISMRSFLLENKNLLATVETEKPSSETATSSEVSIKDVAENAANGPFKCDLCTGNFKAISSLRRHKIKQHDVNTKVSSKESVPSLTPNKIPAPSSITSKFQVTISSKNSRTLSPKQPEPLPPTTPKHLKPMTVEVSGSEFHSCMKCDAKFKLDSNLDKHMKIAHPDPIIMQPIKKDPESDEKEVTPILPSPKLKVKTVEALNSSVENPTKKEVTHILPSPKLKVKTVEALNSSVENPTKKEVTPILPSPKLKVKTVEALNSSVLENPTKKEVALTLTLPSPKLKVKTVEALNCSVLENTTNGAKCNVCEMCGDVFNNAELLGNHVMNHRTVSSENNVTVKTEVGYGLNVVKNDDVKTLKCDQCSKKFIMERNMNLHKRMAHKKASGRKRILPKVPKFNFTCSPCNIKFESKTHLENHENLMHNKEPEKENEVSSKLNFEKVSITKVSVDPVKPACSKSEHSSKQSLKYVKKKIKKEPVEMVLLPCNKCHITFGNTIALNRHQLKRHGTSKLRCLTCKKIFKTKSAYFIHIRNEHKSNSNPGKFPCDVCNLVLQHSSSLSRHKLKAHGKKEKPKDSTADVVVSDRSFITELKKKIVSDEEEKENCIEQNELNSTISDQSADISVTLEETAPEVDLSTSQYFVSHPSMVKPLTNKMHQKLLDKKLIVEDSNLPAGWFILNTLRKGRQSNKEFITPDRKVIRSVDGMREYMRVSDTYSRSDIQSVSKYFRKRMSL